MTEAIWITLSGSCESEEGKGSEEEEANGSFGREDVNRLGCSIADLSDRDNERGRRRGLHGT